MASKKELKRRLKKIEVYIEFLDKLAGLAKESSQDVREEDQLILAHFAGMSTAYGLAAAGLRIRLMEPDHEPWVDRN